MLEVVLIICLSILNSWLLFDAYGERELSHANEENRKEYEYTLLVVRSDGVECIKHIKDHRKDLTVENLLSLFWYKDSKRYVIRNNSEVFICSSSELCYCESIVKESGVD